MPGQTVQRFRITVGSADGRRLRFEGLCLRLAQWSCPVTVAYSHGVRHRGAGPRPGETLRHRAGYPRVAAAFSALYTENGAQPGDHLDEVAAVADDLVDVLVRARDLIQHARVGTALHPGRLRLQVVDGERPARLAPAHLPSGTVRRRLECLPVSETAHEIGAGAHRTGDDAVLTRPGRDRPLAGDQDIRPVVVLLRDVVVVAVDVGEG